MKSTKRATLTFVQELTGTPDQAAHLNNSDDNLATFNRGTLPGKTNEFGGFDFSDIPAGSVINSIAIQQTVKNTAGDEESSPATRFALKIDGEERSVAVYQTDSGGAIVDQEAVFAPGTITVDELRAGRLRVRKTTKFTKTVGGIDPPVPTVP